MNDAHDSVEQKVAAIFAEIAPDRLSRLNGSRPASEASDAFAAALSIDYSTGVARDIAFHLTDWNWDAAFMVAAHLFPERFTPEELAAGADKVLIHAPNHLAAAAKLAGHPIDDIFKVGVCRDSAEGAHGPE